MNNIRSYSLSDSINVILKRATEKKRNFIESVDIALILGIDPKQSNQNVRGSALLPNGSGKKCKILVLTEDYKLQEELLELGAAYCGSDDLIEKINNGFDDFDICITNPDFMPKISKIAKKIGPKGLMPNVKNGTVTSDLKKAVLDALKGKVNFKNDKFGIIHCMVGKVDFNKDHLLENISSTLKAINELKPESVKGKFIKKLFLNSTMGKSIEVDVNLLNLSNNG